MKIDLGKTILEGIRRFYSLQALEEEFLGLGDRYVHSVKGGPFQVSNLTLNHAERRFCQELVGTKTVNEVLQSEYLTDHDTRCILLGLIFMGTVKLEMLPKWEHPYPDGIPYSPPYRAIDPKVNEYVDQVDMLAEQAGQSSAPKILGFSEGAPTESIMENMNKLVTSLHERGLYSETPDFTRLKADYALVKFFDAFNRLTGADASFSDEKPIPDGPSLSDLLEAELKFEEGRSLFNNEQYNDAFDAFIQAAGKDPRRGGYLAWAGWSLFQESLKVQTDIDSDRAKSFVEEALQLDPNLALGHMLLGRIAKEAGDLDQAEIALERAADLFPDDLDTLLELHSVHQLNKKQEDVQKPDIPDSGPVSDYVSHIESWYRVQSEKNLFELLGVSPDDPVDEARKIYFDLSSSLRPPKIYTNSPVIVQEMADEIFHRLTEAYETFSDETRRKKFLKELESSNEELDNETLNQQREEAERLHKRAIDFYENREYKAAGSLFKRAYEKNPDYSMDQAYYADCMYRDFSSYNMSRTEAVQKAKKMLNQVLQKHPDSAQANAFLGRIYLDENKIELAEECLDKALSMDPKNMDALRSFHLLHSGKWHQKRSEMAKAQTESLQELRQNLSKAYDEAFRSDFLQLLEIQADAGKHDIESAHKKKVNEMKNLGANADDLQDPVVQILTEEIIQRLDNASRMLTAPYGMEVYKQALLSPDEIEELIRVCDLSTARECMQYGWKMLDDSDLEKAKEAFEKATELARGSAAAHAMLGWVSWQSAPEGPDGKQARDQALELANSAMNMDAEAWEAWYSLGMIQKSRGSTKEATRYLKKASELNPKKADLHRDVVMMESRSSDDKVILSEVILNRFKGLFKKNKK